MKLTPFSITGIHHKHFDDGVDMDVYYTRLDMNITHINSVHLTYNQNQLEYNFNCLYSDFLDMSGNVVVANKEINITSRVREMMGDVDHELRSVDTDSRLIGRSSVDANGEILPTHTAIQTDEHSTSAQINTLSHAINYDGTINLEAIGNKAQPIRPPAPKRKRTRWELLELD